MWNYVLKSFETAGENMDFDWQLFLYASSQKTDPLLRIYFWEKPAITVGRNQSVGNRHACSLQSDNLKHKEEINISYCKANNIEIVKRPTGGRACLHDCDLTYSFIAPVDLVGRKVPESYKIISDALIEGLSFSGIGVRLSSGRNKAVYKTPLCFSAVSYYEITYNGKKLLGSAQYRGNGGRSGGYILQQGTLILDYRPELYEKCFRNFDRDRITFTSIKEIAGKEPDRNFIAESLKGGFEKQFGVRFKNSQPRINTNFHK